MRIRAPIILGLLTSISLLRVDAHPAEQSKPVGEGVVVFRNANVVAMVTDEVLSSRTVIVEADRIVAVSPAGEAAVPAGARVIEAAGRYLVPGLVDSHVHLRHEAELRRYLVYGVTTVVAMRGTDTVLDLRRRVRAGTLAGPHVLTAGPLIDGDPPIWRGGATLVVTDVGAVRAAVRSHCESDYEFVKVYNNLRPDLLAEVVQGAHACGLPVVAHLPRLPVREEGLARALAAGVDVIAHGEEVFFTHLRGASDAVIAQQGGRVSPELIESAVRMIDEANVHVTPNLSFIAMTRRMLDDLDAVFADPEFSRLPDEVRQLWRDQNPTRRKDLEAFTRRETVKREAVARLTRRLAETDVPLLVGTDASAPGLFPGKSLHQELEELVTIGLTPFQALAAATRTPGRFFQEHLRSGAAGAPFHTLGSGTIEPGQRADLILVRENPLTDIGHLAAIEGVMVGGQWQLPPAER